jgi:hypothetical protein
VGAGSPWDNKRLADHGNILKSLKIIFKKDSHHLIKQSHRPEKIILKVTFKPCLLNTKNNHSFSPFLVGSKIFTNLPNLITHETIS